MLMLSMKISGNRTKLVSQFCNFCSRYSAKINFFFILKVIKCQNQINLFWVQNGLKHHNKNCGNCLILTWNGLIDWLVLGPE